MAEMLTNEKRIEFVQGLMKQVETRVTELLPKSLNLDPRRILAVTQAVILRQHELFELVQANPNARASFMGAILDAARVGLVPDGQEAAFVKYGNKVQLQPMYKGRLKLARRSKEIKDVEVTVVLAKDKFYVRRGLNPRLDYEYGSEPHSETKNPIIGAYAIIHMMNGGVQWDYMPRFELDAARERSPAKNNGPWVTDFGEMCKKTVLTRTLKIAPYSHDVEDDLNRIEAGEDPPEVIELQQRGGTFTAKPETKLDRLAAKLAGPASAPGSDEPTSSAGLSTPADPATEAAAEPRVEPGAEAESPTPASVAAPTPAVHKAAGSSKKASPTAQGLAESEDLLKTLKDTLDGMATAGEVEAFEMEAWEPDGVTARLVPAHRNLLTKAIVAAKAARAS